MSQQTPATIPKALSRRLNRPLTLFWLLLPPLLAVFGSLWLVKWRNQSIDAGAAAKPEEIRRKLPDFFFWSSQNIPVQLAWNEEEQKRKLPFEVEVVFCLDKSGSMGSATRPGDPLYEALMVCRAQSKLLTMAGAKVAAMAFDHEPQVLTDLTTDLRQLDQAWSEVSQGGGTEIPSAVSRSLDMFSNQHGSRQILVLISDGFDSSGDNSSLIQMVRARTPTPKPGDPSEFNYQNNSVIFVGIGFAGSDESGFFDPIFILPHRYHCCDTDPDAMMRLLLETAIEQKILESLGYDAVLNEPIHAAALPWIPTEATNHANSFQVQPKWEELDHLLRYRLTPYLRIPQTHDYELRADSLGVHPVATAPAALSYKIPPKGDEQRRVSGKSPWVFVASPLLLLGPFLPALLYIFTWLRKQQGVLKEPESLAVPGVAPLQPIPLLRKFRAHSTEPYQAGDDQGVVPTAVLALGPGGGRLLAAWLRNRAEAGQPPASQAFYTRYLDVAPHQTNELPNEFWAHHSVDLLVRLPQEKDLAPLVERILSKPSDYSALLEWLDPKRFRGQDLRIDMGCRGDRSLARLALYQDMLAENSQARASINALASWVKSQPRAQIVLLAKADEDLAAWLPDLAFGLKSQLRGQAVPLYLALDLENDPELERQGNDLALFEELRLLQTAHGLPWRSTLCAGRDKHTQNEDVLLPLFDRVLSLEHQEQPAHPYVAGAALSALADRDLEAMLQDVMARDALNTRTAGAARELGFITRLDSTTLIAPIGASKRTLLLDSLSKIMQQNLGCQLDPTGRTVFEERNTKEDQLCANFLAAMGKRAGGAPSLTIWNAIMRRELPDESHRLTLHQFRQDAVQTCAHYLNCSETGLSATDPCQLMLARRGRFHELKRVFTYFNQQLQAVSRSSTVSQSEWNRGLEHELKGLETRFAHWEAALLTSNTPEAPGLIQYIHQVRQQLGRLDPQQARDGRVQIPARKPGIEAEPSAQLDHFIESGSLGLRFQWGVNSQGSDLELLFRTSSVTRFQPENLLELIPTYVNWVEGQLLPQLQTWNIEDWADPSWFERQIETSAPDLGATFAAYQTREPETRLKLDRVIHERFAHPFISPLAQPDRIAMLAVREAKTLPREARDWHRLARLPFILPEWRTFTELWQRFSAETAEIPIHPEPLALLLAREHRIVRTALALVVGGYLLCEKGKDGALVWYLNGPQKRPLSLAGNCDQGQALAQVLLFGHDMEGLPLDANAALAAFNALGSEQRRQQLTAWVAQINRQEAPAAWEIFLQWQALRELEQGDFT